MLTSKEVMAKTGISRATLNNYIALGILPRPEIGPPTPEDPQARRIGYFSDDVVDRIHDVQRMKSEGMMMSQIAAQFAIPPTVDIDDDDITNKNENITFVDPANSPLALRESKPGGPLYLSIEDLPYPAYMLTTNFEVQWWNDAASENLFNGVSGLEGEIEARNIFALLLNSEGLNTTEEQSDVITFHMSIAKRRMPVNAFAGFDQDYGVGTEGRLNSIYDGVVAAQADRLLSQGVSLKIENDVKSYQVIATFFREGTLFTYVPVDESETILDLLARRERVIRDLLKNRQPFRTDLCILSASLEGQAKLKSEMAPDSYFALMNDIWKQMDPILRKFHGVHGNHPDHGLLYYFFPQPDSNFAWNSAACAIAMREEVGEIARSWRGKLSWLPKLHMNIGLEQGRDWFGTIKSSAQYKFAVLGETSKTAETLSRLATAGQILGTKNVIAEFDQSSKDDVQFGITRHDHYDRNFFIPESYSRVRNFVDLTTNSDADLRQLSDLAICEIRDIGQSGETAAPDQSDHHSTN